MSPTGKIHTPVFPNLRAIKSLAYELGFNLVGIAPAVEPPHWQTLGEWVQKGMHAEMEYIPRRLPAYRHPSHVLPGCQSVVVVAAAYRPVLDPSLPLGAGRIAAYALLEDYHRLLGNRLKQLAGAIASALPLARTRVAVDTAPLLERSFAVLAGLGWIGKNTMLLHPQLGSYTLLGTVLSTARMSADLPFDRHHCGRCQACVQACPTGAIVAPGTLDARKCISFWTIEARTLPPRELRSRFGQWFFGCDRCQEVCPWNRRLLRKEVIPLILAEQVLPYGVDMCTVVTATDEQLRSWFGKTPLLRAKAAGLRRNAALVLGNALRTVRAKGSQPADFQPMLSQPEETSPSWDHPSSLPPAQESFPGGNPGETLICQMPADLEAAQARWRQALGKALQDPYPVVRQAAAWALGQAPQSQARQMLIYARQQESDPAVQEEIRAALEEVP
jgi:epoxyqueuosine reductase